MILTLPVLRAMMPGAGCPILRALGFCEGVGFDDLSLSPFSALRLRLRAGLRQSGKMEPMPGCPRLATSLGGKVGLMADTTNPQSFEEIVEWAYSTLPQKIRDLPDFPGIQVVDEPPADVLEDISNREKWRGGLSDHLKSGQRLSLQNRPMEDAGTQVFYPITGC